MAGAGNDSHQVLLLDSTLQRAALDVISHLLPLEKAPQAGTLHVSSVPILRALRENDPGSVVWAEHWVTRE